MPPSWRTKNLIIPVVVLGLVGARPTEQKKGADQGIDGRLFFHDEGGTGKTKQILFSVKAGHVNVSQLRDLRGVIDREKAEIGVCFASKMSPSRCEQKQRQQVSINHPGNHPKLQILTIEELFEGKGLTTRTCRKSDIQRAPKVETPVLSKWNLPPLTPRQGQRKQRRSDVKQRREACSLSYTYEGNNIRDSVI